MTCRVVTQSDYYVKTGSDPRFDRSGQLNPISFFLSTPNPSCNTGLVLPWPNLTWTGIAFAFLSEKDLFANVTD